MPKKEKQVKLEIGNWLKGYECKVYDENRVNLKRTNWDGTFHVSNIQRGRKPDLVIHCTMRSVAGEKRIGYIALEVKTGYKHDKLVEGLFEVIQYFSDCYYGTKYAIEEHRKETVSIAVIALATNFSKKGHLYKHEKIFGRRLVAPDNKNKFYPMTFTFARLLQRYRLNILNNLREQATIPEIQKKVKTLSPYRLPQVGVLINDPASAEEDVPMLITSEEPYYWRLSG